ncbi:hypothetical protein [Pyrobaculum neutrophilum]|uniref:Uncharacterized protein n=1 Tax=Pyrobaculum neutrophilum (strain DSM 2338 / JCM 9278 / NBRC 100436 / V24Sta) TaxID=444157 RepID=B1YDB4_PYRNV|nr:hypothetical protein [Pyrobaculum neutrophilum]ACB39777.1 conserved hypothetical protein [Pyrobaculum neutrophilum V24Sta]
MKRISLRITHASYGDEELLSDFLVSLGGVYNVYKDGDVLTIEAEDSTPEAEVVRRVLDLGYEVVLPHFVFKAAPNLDEREVARRLLQSGLAVAAEYYPRTGRGVLIAAPNATREDVERLLRGAVGRAEVESEYVYPVRMSFG